MAIALKLETREQNYNIYGGSAGFSKIIQATGLTEGSLTTEKLLEVFSDLERRKAIISVLLDEGEFEPEVDFSTKPKRDALTLKLAKQLDTGWIIMLFANLANELNEAAVGLSGAISPPSLVEDVQDESQSPLEAIAISNISIIE